MNKKIPGKLVCKILLLPLCMLLLTISAYSQTKIELIDGREVTLKSSVLNEDRVISIYLPRDYDISSQRYPVIFLLDGETHFHHTTGAINFLSSQGIIPQSILVSIKNIDRNRDFSPVHDNRIPTSGGAAKFLNFLSDELTPFIKKNYRTSNFSVIIGHSFGGTFITYSLLEKPELFDAYIAISPFLQYADEYLIKESGKMLRSNYPDQKYYYMTVGDEPEYFSTLDKFTSLVKEKSEAFIDLEYLRMPAENHNTIPYLSIFNGLKYIFSDWQLPAAKMEQDISEIDEYFAALSAKYDMDIKTPENVINILGYTYLQKQNIEKAIIFFTENTKRYPKSSNVYDSLGEAYENNNQLELAKKNYQKAYDLGKAQNHINTPIYLKNLNRVTQK